MCHSFEQLLAIAKHHNKSPYTLVSPYFFMVAPYLVSRICTHPSLLAESCRFLAISPTDFITLTLSRTLPDLFANCNNKALNKVADEVSKKPPSLFMNYAHEILAEVFLQSSPGRTKNALSFILKVLRDAADNVIIDIPNIITSCIVPLLAEIVSVMGAEDPERATKASELLNYDCNELDGFMYQAASALEMVRKSVFVPSRLQKVLPSETLGEFLKKYLLGIISHINEMLQDVQGKKTISSKQQILRSLGALVLHMGPAISIVAPQACFLIRVLFFAS
jgi:serine/threonine-protein kinase ATR